MQKKRSQTGRHIFAAAVVLALAVTAAVAAAPAQALTNCSPSSSWGTNRADLATQVASLINQYRASKGLSQLAISPALTASSEWKSLHMAGYGYFAHDDQAPPVSRGAYQRAKDCGFSGTTWGENIAYGYSTAQSVVSGWLGSAGHKANIENASFKTTGLGVAVDTSGRLYWTQSFGNDTSGTSPAPPPPPGGSDTQKPTTPAGVTVTSTARTSVTIRWNASTDNVGVTAYRVWRGTTFLGTTTSRSASLTRLTCGSSYQLGVEAIDAAGNVSSRALRTVATRSCSSGL